MHTGPAAGRRRHCWPGRDRDALRVFLGTPHATMPNLRLAPEQADDLIAYILSLKGYRSGT